MKANKSLAKKQKGIVKEPIKLSEKEERFQKLERREGAQKLPKDLVECQVEIFEGEKMVKGALGKYQDWNPSQFMLLLDAFTHQLNGKDRDTLLQKIEDVLDEETKGKIWEHEHVNIENALDTLTREYNRFTARIEIASKTGYSLSTIDRHIEGYLHHSGYKRKKEELLLLRERLLSRCYILASKGDIKAMRLFLDATADKKTGEVQTNTTIRNQQNNFIQIDNLIITEEKIRQLPDDTRNQIKDIFAMLVQR